MSLPSDTLEGKSPDTNSATCANIYLLAGTKSATEPVLCLEVLQQVPCRKDSLELWQFYSVGWSRHPASLMEGQRNGSVRRRASS